MRRKKPVILLIFLFGLIGFRDVSAQVKINAEISSGAGFERNVFNSPESYLTLAGDTLNRSALVQDALFWHTEAGVKFKWKRNKWQFEWDTGGEVRRYDGLKQANTNDFQTTFGFTHKGKKNWTKGAELRLRMVDRLGINVLGSELLTPFSFSQAEVNGFATRKWKKSELTIKAKFIHKDYDECVGCGLLGETLSLTQNEIDVALEEEIILKEIDRLKQKLSFSIRFRDRQYKEWINYDVLDPNFDGLGPDPFLPIDSALTYSPRHWQYYIGRVDYTLPLSKIAKVKAALEYTRRQDVSDGDFSFSQWQPGIYLYVKKDPWNARLYMSYTVRDYSDRLAQQLSGPPLPNLSYRYLRASLKVERKIKGNWFAFVDGGVAYRNSNTSAVDTRVRRSYFNEEIMLGAKYKIEKKRAKRQPARP